MSLDSTKLFTDNDLYDGLTDDQLKRLLDLAKVRELPARTYLFHQHSEANSLYNIDQGVLMVERSTAAGRRQIMSFVFAGNFLGFTHSDFFEYSVQSLAKSKVLEFPRKDFLALCAEIPTLKKNIDTITGKVMMRLFDQLFAVGQKKAHERVGYLLHQLFERQTIAGCYSFELVMSRQDMADYLGLTLETVSRAFTRLQKENIIKVLSAHYVEVLDEKRLEAMAYSEDIK